MLAKPNQTGGEGTLRAICADAGSLGANIETELKRNVSPFDDADFLKLQSGEILSLFCAEAPVSKVAEQVRLHARLLGGPRGQLAILAKMEPLSG